MKLNKINKYSLILLIDVFMSSVCYSANVFSQEYLSLNKQYSFGNVPKVMMLKMMKVGCLPITNYYSNFIVEWSPFAWSDKGNYVFLCERKDSLKNEKIFVLIFQRKGGFNTNNASCKPEIKLNYKPAGVVYDGKKNIRYGFKSWESDKDLKVTTGMKKNRITVATEDGGFFEYICIGDSWYYRGSE